MKIFTVELLFVSMSKTKRLVFDVACFATAARLTKI